jgi:hypothetical protein
MKDNISLLNCLLILESVQRKQCVTVGGKTWAESDLCKAIMSCDTSFSVTAPPCRACASVQEAETYIGHTVVHEGVDLVHSLVMIRGAKYDATLLFLISDADGDRYVTSEWVFENCNTMGGERIGIPV